MDVADAVEAAAGVDVVKAADLGPLTAVHRLLESAESGLCHNVLVLPGAPSSDHRLPPDAELHICADELPKSAPVDDAEPCVVYSFGIADNWIFDDMMVAKGASTVVVLIL